MVCHDMCTNCFRSRKYARSSFFLHKTDCCNQKLKLQRKRSVNIPKMKLKTRERLTRSGIFHFQLCSSSFVLGLLTAVNEVLFRAHDDCFIVIIILDLTKAKQFSLIRSNSILFVCLTIFETLKKSIVCPKVRTGR